MMPDTRVSTLCATVSIEPSGSASTAAMVAVSISDAYRSSRNAACAVVSPLCDARADVTAEKNPTIRLRVSLCACSSNTITGATASAALWRNASVALSSTYWMERGARNVRGAGSPSS